MQKWLFVFKEMLLESYFVVSHSALLILIRLEKYTLSLKEEYVSVGMSNVRNDWNWVVWNGNFSYSWNLKDDSFLSHVHSHYLSELTVWFTSIESKLESLTSFRPLPSISFACCCSSLYQTPVLPPSACLRSQLNFHRYFVFSACQIHYICPRKTWKTKKHVCICTVKMLNKLIFVSSWSLLLMTIALYIIPVLI